jgi:RNA polymerase-binding transcription factor DksA
MAELTHASLRAQLTDERERLLDQLRQLGRGPGAESSAFDEGFADSGQVTAERGEVDALAGTLLETLQEIDDALAKFDAGTYGRCEQCGAQISEARLEAMPAARLCITCASKRR